MYFEDQSLPELHYMKHRHDDDDDYVNYEEKVLNNSLSSYIFNNDMMYLFLNKIRKLVSMMFDNHNIMKNFKNFIVDKYYFKHKN